MMKKLSLIILLALFTSCSRDIHPIAKKTLKQKNPTTYVFNYSAQELKQRIVAAFQIERQSAGSFCVFLRCEAPFLISAETKERATFARHLFDNPENTDDVYLHSYGEPFGLSAIYFANGKPLRYRAAFHLHLAGINEHSTKVTVLTQNPTVINGAKCCSPHGYYSNDVTVEPTTIEEYRILLYIGQVLNVRDMPPLQTPDDN
jgi:hypothetical protein